jgi:NAD(P)-dependent dehydrogenase (short-subunit alcohol dehydrogenase family)
MTTAVPAQREPELLGQTVALIGGSADIGLKTARRARSEGADVILTGRNPQRLEQAARDVDARSTAAFDATDAAALKRFFDRLPAPIDHDLVTGPGPSYAPLLEMAADQVRDVLSDHVVLGLEVARNAAGKMRPGGTLLLMGGTGGRKINRDLGIVSAATAVLPPFTAALALELAPIRVTSSPPASSTPRCRRRTSPPKDSKPDARSSARRSPSGESSARPTSPRSPFTSWPTPLSPAPPTTSTAASSSSPDRRLRSGMDRSRKRSAHGSAG